MENPEYSIVIPVYNSEDSIEELFLRTKAVFEKLHKTYEVIFVEDGSDDNSWKIINQLKQKFPELIIAIRLSKNFGQHNASFCGMNYSKGKFIITIDDDLQIPPEEIKKLIKNYNENPSDLVYGFYTKKQHSFYRNIGSKSLKKTAKKLYKSPGEGSSFRLMTNELAQNLITHHHNFIFIDELLLWYTDKISFVEVTHLKRKYNKSGYNSKKLMKLVSNLIIYYTSLPLKFMVYAGLVLSIITFFIAIIFIIKKIFYDVPLGYTSIIVTILFSTSIILFSLGVIGEYLRRMYLIQNKKPPYTIKEILK